MPRALTRAGFEVALLTPRNSLAEKSRYVSKVGYLPDNANMHQWLHAFAATVKATQPRLVVPCDDAAFRLLQRLAESPPQGFAPAAELAALIRHSLGDPAGYRSSVEKTLLPPAAAGLGVRVPAFVVETGMHAARIFAEARGYPVVVKRDHSSAAEGVRICGDEAALASAFSELLRPHPTDFAGTGRRLLVQEHIAGSIKNYAISAWEGRVLASYAALKVEMNPPRSGPSTVTLYHRDDAVREMAEAIVGGLHVSGFLSLECVMSRTDGLPYLLEINRRLVPGGHRGSDFGVDHCAALHCALHGLPQQTRSTLDPGEEHLSVHFPQEWLRDPGSEWLRDNPVDVPWDDPELIEAMLAMRHEE
jgi:predicted ATP-grasp superfamily ATP-dependent carboligase